MVNEPFETLYLEVPDEAVGNCMQSLANRKGQLDNPKCKNGRTFMEMTIPTRGLIGFEFELLTLTNEGINLISSRNIVRQWRYSHPAYSTLISIEKGEAMTYALGNIETRGKLFIGPGESIRRYAGRRKPKDR